MPQIVGGEDTADQTVRGASILTKPAAEEARTWEAEERLMKRRMVRKREKEKERGKEEGDAAEEDTAGTGRGT